MKPHEQNAITDTEVREAIAKAATEAGFTYTGVNISVHDRTVDVTFDGAAITTGAIIKPPRTLDDLANIAVRRAMETATTKTKVTIPPLTAVKSSTAQAAGHDGKAMFIRFNNGKTYHYPSATQDDYAALMGAESFGKHLGATFLKKHTGELVPQADGA